MQLNSPLFHHKQEIPQQYTCLGPNINPPLEFIDVPENTQSFVLIVEDRDATPKPWVHWLVFNIDGSLRKIDENALPATAIEGQANGGTHRYEGPCPKYFSGTHHYSFTLYALDQVLSIPNDSDKERVEEAMQGHIVDKAELIGLCTAPEKT